MCRWADVQKAEFTGKRLMVYGGLFWRNAARTTQQIGYIDHLSVECPEADG